MALLKFFFVSKAFATPEENKATYLGIVTLRLKTTALVEYGQISDILAAISNRPLK